MATSRRNLEEQKYMIHCCFKHHKFHMEMLRTEPNGRPASNCLTYGRLVSEWPSEACGVCCRTRRKGRRHYNRQQLWFSSVRLVLTEGRRATWDLPQLRKEQRLQENVGCEVCAVEHPVGAEAADTSSLCLVCDVRVRPNPVYPLHAVPNFVDPLQHPGNTVPRVDLV